MDEVLRELEVRKALLTALLLRDEELCSFFPLVKRVKLCRHVKICLTLVTPWALCAACV